MDDHTLFRESLSRLLEAESEFRIVGSCATAAEALKILALTEVEVVLLDYDLGEHEGTRLLDAAKQRGFSGRILMVTAGMSDAVTLRVLEAGSAGIFLKHSPPTQLIEAIQKVAAGGVWLDSKAVMSLVAGASGRSNEQRTSEPLNDRERSVLRAVFEGLSNKEIGVKLHLSESSVKAVLQRLFQKTGVRTRSQLVRIALERHEHDWLMTEPPA